MISGVVRTELYKYIDISNSLLFGVVQQLPLLAVLIQDINLLIFLILHRSTLELVFPSKLWVEAHILLYTKQN